MTRIRTEDEWFAKHEKTLLDDIKRERRRREERVAAALKEEEGRKRKELHWMKCPKCGSNMLQEPLQDNVMVDRCSRCGGLFFDRGELEDLLLRPLDQKKGFRIGIIDFIFPSRKSKEEDKEKVLAEFATDRDQRRIDVEKWHSTEEGRKLKELHWMNCPKCGSQLEETDIKSELLIDDCTLCRGIFLDYGELQMISGLTEEDRKQIRDGILALSIATESSEPSTSSDETK